MKDQEEIIRSAQVCRLGLTDGHLPYIIPLCFGYRDRTLYFHSASDGKKIALLRKNPQVCFEFDHNVAVNKAEQPCKWGMKYQSIIGYGKAVFIKTFEEKKEALKIIMSQYSEESYSFIDSAVNSTTIFKVPVTEMTGKQSYSKSPHA